MDDMHMVGVMHGLVSALVTLGNEISRESDRRFPANATRKRAAHEARIAPLQRAYDRIDRQLRDCQAAYRTEVAPV